MTDRQTDWQTDRLSHTTRPREATASKNTARNNIKCLNICLLCLFLRLVALVNSEVKISLRSQCFDQITSFWHQTILDKWGVISTCGKIGGYILAGVKVSKHSIQQMFQLNPSRHGVAIIILCFGTIHQIDLRLVCKI